MIKKRAWMTLVAMLFLFVAAPVFATTPMQGEAAAPTGEGDVQMWIAIAAGFGMAIASSVCGLSQGRSVIAACEGIARNPSAAGQIRGSLIIGLILIESLAIYTLLVALILLFLRWPAA